MDSEFHQIALTKLLGLALIPKIKIKILICCRLGKSILCDQVFDSISWQGNPDSGIQEIFACEMRVDFRNPVPDPTGILEVRNPGSTD